MRPRVGLAPADHWGYSCLNSHVFQNGMGESNRKIAINKKEHTLAFSH